MTSVADFSGRTSAGESVFALNPTPNPNYNYYIPRTAMITNKRSFMARRWPAM